MTGWLVMGGAAVVTGILMPLVIRGLSKDRLIRPNYRGSMIVTGSGIVIIISALTAVSVVANPDWLPEVGVGMLLLALVGLVDDCWGTGASRGLKGHFLSLRQGVWTTGWLKALTGALVGFGLSWQWSVTPGELIVNWMVLTLSANLINLLDLRPGRAIKGWLLMVALLLLGAQHLPLFLWGILGSALVYLTWDLQARVMMGDAGSNPLGLSLGIGAVLLLDIPERIIFLGGLLGVHWLAERSSLTAIIERIRWLKYLDQLGRARN